MPFFPQQIECARKFQRLARGLNTSPYGTGKTGALILILMGLCPPKRALIVVPNNKIEDWVNELRRWGRKGWLIAMLGGKRIRTRKQRMRAFMRPHHIALLNAEGIAVMGSLLLDQYDVLLVDEIHDYRNAYGKISRALAALSANVSHVYGASGSPLTEQLTDLYGVFRVVNPQMVDATFEPWRSRYFVYESRPNAKTGRKEYPKWHPRDGTVEVLSDALHSISYYCAKESLPVTWPKEIDAHPIKVKLSEGVRKIYDSFERDSEIVLKNVNVSVDNVRPRLIKLLQIANGWMFNEHQKPIVLGKADKLIALSHHLEEIRRTGRVLIWSVFPAEIRWIAQLLQRMGMSCGQAYGGIKMAERERVKNSFNAGNLDALVANPAVWAAGQGLYADYATTFSRNWSGDDHNQKRGRPVRADSKQERVVFTEIVTENSVDEGCLSALQVKSDLLAFVMRRRLFPRG